VKGDAGIYLYQICIVAPFSQKMRRVADRLSAEAPHLIDLAVHCSAWVTKPKRCQWQIQQGGGRESYEQ